MGNHLRMTHDQTQISPDDGIQLLGWDQAGGAMLFPIGDYGRQLASADVVLVSRAGMTGSTGATQVAVAATHQTAQQVRVAGVATRLLLIGGQTALRRIEHVGCHHRWHRHGNPPVTRCWLDADAASDRLQCRTASLGRASFEASARGFADIHGVGQDSAHARGGPETAAARRRNAARGQAYGEGVQGGLAVSIGLEQFAHDSRGCLVDLDQGRIAWPLRMHAIPVGSDDPGQEPSSAQFGLASTSHAIGDERAFVLSDGAANLCHEVFVRIVSCRAINKHHADSPPLEFFKEHHLVHVVARKTVGSANQHHIEGCPCGLVTQRIETRSLELGSSVAIIPENMRFLDDPTRSISDVGPQECYLLFDRLRLMLLFRRHSDIERCSHDRLLRLAEPPPNTTEAGTHDPTDAARLGRRPARVPRASFCAPAFPLC